MTLHSPFKWAATHSTLYAEHSEPLSAFISLHPARFMALANSKEVAASKGLVTGPIKLFMENRSIISCFSNLDDNNYIPPIAMVRQIDFGETRWVLVVEKEVMTLSRSQHDAPRLTCDIAGDIPDISSLSVLEALHPRPRNHSHGKAPIHK